jgi:hypothetical protein
MDFQDLVGRGIKMVILGALVFYICIDQSNNPKNLDLDIEQFNEINVDVTETHTNKSKLTELGYTLTPRLKMDRSKIYPVILGIDMFKQLKYKEFDHFAFQYKTQLIQFAYS